MGANIYTPYISDIEQIKILRKSMTGRLQYTLLNDFLAKYSLQNDLFALAGLLAALMRIDVNAITNIDILNPIKPGDTITEKNCVLDLNLEMNHYQIINIEIQTRFQEFWPERSITYLCRNFDQLQLGNNYGEIHPCLHIGILSHDLFRKGDSRYTDEFYSEYAILNKNTHTEYSSKFEIRVLSLNHLENASPEDKKQENGLYYWAKLFKAISWEELLMTAQENTRMQSFIGTVRKLSAEEEVAQACERRRRYNIEINTYEKMVKDAQREAAEAKAEAKAEVDKARAEAKVEAKAEAKAEVDKARAEAKAEADRAKSEAKAEADRAKAEADKVKKELAEAKLELERIKKQLNSVAD